MDTETSAKRWKQTHADDTGNKTVEKVRTAPGPSIKYDKEQHYGRYHPTNRYRYLTENLRQPVTHVVILTVQCKMTGHNSALRQTS